jgi:hypothetical protein
MGTMQKSMTWAGIALILATGLIHLLNAPDSFEEATYKGLLFVANGAGAAVAAFGIYRGVKSWGWGLGLLVAGGALVAYILSRTIGLPGLEAEPDAWFEPLGLASLIAEGLFIGVGASAFSLSARRSDRAALRPQVD